MILEITYVPAVSKVEKKNTKYGLALAIMQIWRAVEGCKDEETKAKIMDILLPVL